MIKATLITGVAGTTGSQILDLLLESEDVKRGERVILGVDNFFRGSLANIVTQLQKSPGKFYFFEKDFREISECASRRLVLDEDKDLICRIDEVYHMAAVVPTHYFYDSPDLTYEVNCKGTIDLFNWCLNTGVKRFVVGSSSEIYGHISPEDLPAKETTMSHFDSEEDSTRWSYAEGKLLTEHYLNHYKKDMERVCHLRFANTYGPRDLDDNHVLPYLINCVVNHKEIHLNKDSDHFFRTFLNNHDSARACVEVMNKGKNGVAYNVGSEEEVSITNLLKLICEIGHEDYGIDTSDLKVIKDIDRPGDPRRRVLDTTRLFEDTGFRPVVSLREGIRQMFDKVIKGVES